MQPHLLGRYRLGVEQIAQAVAALQAIDQHSGDEDVVLTSLVIGAGTENVDRRAPLELLAQRETLTKAPRKICDADWAWAIARVPLVVVMTSVLPLSRSAV